MVGGAAQARAPRSESRTRRRELGGHEQPVNGTSELSKSKARLRILIVEDFPIVALGIKTILEDLGAEVVAVAPSAEDAIEAAEQHRPDVVFMDVDLGEGMDGVEAALAIRDRFGIRSVFLTGYGSIEVRERAARADPIAILDKVSSPRTIAQLLRSLAQ